MSEDFSYTILAPSTDGYSTVEYKHQTLGRITRRLVIPFDQSEDVIHQTIIESLPRQDFYARRLAIATSLTEAPRSGKFSATLEPDWFSDIVTRVETLTPK